MSGQSAAWRVEDTLVDKFELAKRLGVHFSTIERLIKTDELRVYRLGPVSRRQQLRFRWADIESWLATRVEGRRTS